MVTPGNNVQQPRLGAKELDSDLATRSLSGPLTGYSEAICELDARVAKVVSRDVAVCLIGEEGSGKELVARTIHQGSERRGGPFVRVDCGACEGKEQEILLFGEEQGSSPQGGAFERASGGVLFLNHVAALSPRTQAALAQTLSMRKVRRVGSVEEVPVNVRIIAAHNGDLRSFVEAGKFREDLFFRLVVYPLVVPALRERRQDIPHIVDFFLKELAGDTPRSLTVEALETLVHYNWPGNIRELEHVVHRALLAAHDQVIAWDDLPAELRELQSSPAVGAHRGTPSSVTPQRALSPGAPLPLAASVPGWSPLLSGNEVVPLRDLERLAIEHALRVTNGSVSLAAQKLGIGRATLYRRIASLDLSQNVA